MTDSQQEVVRRAFDLLDSGGTSGAFAALADSGRRSVLRAMRDGLTLPLNSEPVGPYYEIVTALAQTPFYPDGRPAWIEIPA
jgi:hypothetical protein